MLPRTIDPTALDPDTTPSPTRSTGALAVPGIFKPLPTERFVAHGSAVETRLEAHGDTYLTPTDRFFVRNQSSGVRIDPARYRLKVWGPGARRAVEFTYDDLLAAADTSVNRAIECAGNGRRFFRTHGRGGAPGSQWGLGAIGVAEWTGVRLGELLARAGIRNRAVDVMPVGLDHQRVRRPMPVAKASEPDTLIAVAMNGEPLGPDHGFPARVIAPGWAGIASIKWVGEILVADRPVASPWNTESYVMPAPAAARGRAAAEPVPIAEMGVKAALELPIPAELPAGPVVLQGRAWSGAAAIARVDVRIDDDPTWWPAAVLEPNEPRAWARWRFACTLTPGDHVVRARATDTLGRVQPEVTPWNDLGYLYDAVVAHGIVAHPTADSRPSADPRPEQEVSA